MTSRAHTHDVGDRPARCRPYGLLAVVAVLLSLTGCGDDRSEGAARAPSPTATTSATSAAPTPTAPSTPVAAVDLGQRTISRTELTGGPDFLMAAHGLLWVKHEDPVLVGLDPATGAEQRRLPLARNPDGLNGTCHGIGGDADHLWVCTGNGLGLVPREGTAEVVPVSGVRKMPNQTQFPVQGGRVWVIEPDGTTLTGLRVADGGDPVQLQIDVRCVDVTAGAGSYLWLACPSDGVGLRLDIDTGDVLRVPDLRGATAVSAAEDVYLSVRGGLVRVDQATGEVLAKGPAGPPAGYGLHAQPDAVWVRGAAGDFLVKLDPESLATVERITAPGAGGGTVLLAYEALWTSDYDAGVVHKVRPAG